MLQVQAITTKDFLKNNSYVIYENGHALVVDPAANAQAISDFIKQQGLKLEGVLITHAHPDHTNQLKQLIDLHNAPVYIHKNEEKALHYPDLSHRFGSVEGVPFTFFDKPFNVGPFHVHAILAPGHTPGSTIFEIGEYWFTGDVLFETEIGRDDYPGGSPADSAKTARAILAVKKDLVVMPGHNNYGMPLAEVQKHNPELKEAAETYKQNLQVFVFSQPDGLKNNAYVLVNGRRAIVIDPAFQEQKIERFLKEQALSLVAILLTHAHFDHMGDGQKLAAAHQVNVHVSELDKPLFKLGLLSK